MKDPFIIKSLLSERWLFPIPFSEGPYNRLFIRSIVNPYLASLVPYFPGPLKFYSLVFRVPLPRPSSTSRTPWNFHTTENWTHIVPREPSKVCPLTPLDWRYNFPNENNATTFIGFPPVSVFVIPVSSSTYVSHLLSTVEIEVRWRKNEPARI